MERVGQWKRYALERLTRRGKGVLRAAHTYTAIIRESPPPPPPGSLQVRAPGGMLVPGGW